MPRCELAGLVTGSLWVRSSTLLFEGGFAPQWIDFKPLFQTLFQRELGFKLYFLSPHPTAAWVSGREEPLELLERSSRDLVQLPHLMNLFYRWGN